MKPGPSIAPVPDHGGCGNTQAASRFFDRESCEITQVDHSGLTVVMSLQMFQSLVQVEEFHDGEGRFAADDIADCHPIAGTVTFLRRFQTGIVNQYSPHRLGRGAEEVSAALPVAAAVVGGYETRIGFVNERGRLERMIRPLHRHPSSGQILEGLINQWQQLLRRRGIALIDSIEDLRHVIHIVQTTERSDRMRVILSGKIWNATVLLLVLTHQ